MSRVNRDNSGGRAGSIRQNWASAMPVGLRGDVGRASYTEAMSQSRDELQHLIDSLPDEQVEQVLADVRRRTGPKRVPSDKAFAWVGSGTANNGRSDNATRVDELLADGFGRS